MSLPSVVTITVPANLGAAERAVIEATLKHFNGHRERTAVCLGISLKTLYNRLQQYRLDDARQGAAETVRDLEAGRLAA